MTKSKDVPFDGLPTLSPAQMLAAVREFRAHLTTPTHDPAIQHAATAQK